MMKQLLLVFLGFMMIVVPGTARAAETTKHPLGVLKAIEPEDVEQAEGLLRKRASYTYEMYKSYTPEHVLTLNYSNQASRPSFPGDTIGRYILSATLLSRALHQPEPETLRKVMAALPSMLNSEGYLGWVLPKDRADEMGLSNVMWSNGLTEYYQWTKDKTALKMNQNVFNRIVLPVKDAYYYYYAPEKNDGKIKWVHCTGDTAQAFGIIDPATRGYPLFPSPELKAEIDELIRLYRKIDHVKIKAQTHAVLFATRGILRWYELQGNPEHLQFAESLYQQYRQEAMTENYENYNWFGKPTTTEGCAICDSLTVALKLWQLTGKNEYLEDAQLILFNGLLANQMNGDFGVNNCVGAKDQVFLRHGKPAPWCCSVWGGMGLAKAMQYSQFLKQDGVVVTIPGNNTITAKLPDGLLKLKQTTGYPREGGVRFTVEGSESRKERELLVFMPSWITAKSIAVTVNGKTIESDVAHSFLRIHRVMAKGDVIDVRFKQSFRCADPLYPKRMPGYHRYFYGPLLLGMDTKEEVSLPRAIEFEADKDGSFRAYPGGATPIAILTPVCDLMDLKDEAKRARTGSAQVLFQD